MQMIRHTKRKKIHRTQHNTLETKIETHNRYGLLTNEAKEGSIDGNPSSTKIHKLPPIFVHGVTNYGEMIKRIRDIAADEQYCTKTLAKNVKLLDTINIQKNIQTIKPTTCTNVLF